MRFNSGFKGLIVVCIQGFAAVELTSPSFWNVAGHWLMGAPTLRSSVLLSSSRVEMPKRFLDVSTLEDETTALS